MTFRPDDRGVTVQVGAILLFATLVVAMSLYQATAIPTQNAKVEFRHNERVQGQMQNVRNAILRTGATGTDQPTSVTLGAQYPGHVFFVNPPPATGTLRTVKLGRVGIENLTATNPETADYLNASGHSFSTRALVYAPNYNQYGNAPDTVYENTVLYNRGASGNATLTDQRFIHGKQITLVTLDGNLSESRAGTVSLDPHASSPTTETRTISVRSDEHNPVIRVPTTLSKQKWEQLLNEQMAPDGYVKSVESGPGDTLVVTLKKNVTYDLRIANVAVGTGATPTSATYITNVGPTNVTTAGKTTLVAEVRDKFNNPVSGVTVNATTGESGTTDEQGRVRFTYSSDTPGTEPVILSIDDGKTTEERVEFRVHTVANDKGSGVGSGGSYRVTWVASNGFVTCPTKGRSHTTCTLTDGWRNSATLTAHVTYDGEPVTDTNVDFGLNRTGIVSTSPPNNTTDRNGNVTVTITPDEIGTARLLAASGGNASTATIHVVEPDDAGGIVYNDDAVVGDGEDSGTIPGGITFSVENKFNYPVEITDIEITPLDGNIGVIADGSQGENRPGQSEVYVGTGTDSGYVDFSELQFGRTSDGTRLPRTVDLNRDGRAQGRDPTLSSEGNATFWLYEFFEQSDASSNVNMTGKKVDITVTYERPDGTTGQKQFTVVPESSGAGNGGSGNHAADSVSYVGNSGRTFNNDDSAVQFQVRNSGSNSATITGISVEMDHGNYANQLREGWNFGSEVTIFASDFGSYDSSGAYQLGNKVTLTNDATVDGGETATVWMMDFEKNGDEKDMSGKNLTVTLYFSDGSHKELHVTA